MSHNTLQQNMQLKIFLNKYFLQAFTGSIVEHAESLPKTSREQSSTSQVD